MHHSQLSIGGLLNKTLPLPLLDPISNGVSTSYPGKRLPLGSCSHGVCPQCASFSSRFAPLHTSLCLATEEEESHPRSVYISAVCTLSGLQVNIPKACLGSSTLLRTASSLGVLVPGWARSSLSVDACLRERVHGEAGNGQMIPAHLGAGLISCVLLGTRY